MVGEGGNVHCYSGRDKSCCFAISSTETWRHGLEVADLVTFWIWKTAAFEGVIQLSALLFWKQWFLSVCLVIVVYYTIYSIWNNVKCSSCIYLRYFCFLRSDWWQESSVHNFLLSLMIHLINWKVVECGLRHKLSATLVLAHCQWGVLCR